ncbi:MAG: 4a-hydroxytetrahydrobiopterin dehydratase [Phycisphaerales bacterium]|nr:4a-hydroxytetrahydrobiopterin dehydratase [Phycisphaerales bacterium]
MTKLEKLTPAQVEAGLARLDEWSTLNDAIQRTYLFKDFNAAIAFVNQIAAFAEAADHHPDILIRYNKVTLTLSTHDAGGITEKDFALAEKADAAV